jgi:nucleotide-binding universal stress UspA family protein
MAHSVTVGVDDGPCSGAAVDWAADEARFRGTRLHLVHAWLEQPYDTPEGRGNAFYRQAGEELLRGLVERASNRHPSLEVTSQLMDAGPLDALTSASTTAGLLVLGTRGAGGFPGLLTGSTSLRMAATAACPVVVVPAAAGEADDAGTRRGVAVGVHGRGPCEGLLAFAFETAQRRGLPLRIVHAWRYPLVLEPGHANPPVYEQGHVAGEEARLVAEILAGWRQKYPDVPVEEDIVRSAPAKHLVAVSATQHLVVVGRHRTTEGPLRRLGSVSQAVLHHAECPVAVVPPDQAEDRG